MGGSGTTNPAYYASSKSLNYAITSNNINNSIGETVSAIPYTLSYKDTVGLFGAENIFIKVTLDIQSATSAFINDERPENTYYPVWTQNQVGTTNFYDTAVFDFRRDLNSVNNYAPARISNELSSYNNPYVRIDLNNLKTGNKYIDNWFDVRMYDRNKMEVEYDVMYVPIKYHFYLGFHARNTRRLPYNVEVTVGQEYLEYNEIPASERRYIKA